MVACRYGTLKTSIGTLTIVCDDESVKDIYFEKKDRPVSIAPEWRRGGELVNEVKRQLNAYFAGELQEFDLPLDPDGTEFQQAVWDELCRIPYGETITYGELAKRIGKPKASRAVGAANGQNPIPIVIPCHRVIGSNGKLTGFGGGLPTKEKLLDLESPLFARR